MDNLLVDVRETSGSSAGNLTEEMLKTFVSIGRTSVHPKGARLFVEGILPGGAYILTKGRAKLSTLLENDRIIILRVVPAGQFIGLNATVSNKPYEVTAETMTSCEVIFIKRGDLLRILSEDPQTRLGIIRLLSREYRIALEQIRILANFSEC